MLTEEEILELIKYAKTIEKSKIHIGIHIENGKTTISFADSVSLDIVKESLENKTYKEIKKILKSYKVLSEDQYYFSHLSSGKQAD